VSRRHVVFGSTATAVDQTRQQSLGSALLVDLLQWHTPHSAHVLRPLPDAFIHNPHVRRILPLPFAFWISARYALACCRVFHEPLAVVDDHAVVEFVVEQAVSALVRADQRRQVPFAAGWPGNAFLIERSNNRHRASAGDVFSIDAAHDGRFLFVDDAAAPIIERRDDIVAIALAAGDAPGLHAAYLAAPGLLREIFQE
jgi:hypothetical protein